MDTEVFRELRRQAQRASEARRVQADRDYLPAVLEARKAGLELARHSDVHYSLRSKSWQLDIYPGNQRLFRAKAAKAKGKARAPYLIMPADRPWRLPDVVEAAVRAIHPRQQRVGERQRTEAGDRKDEAR